MRRTRQRERRGTGAVRQLKNGCWEAAISKTVNGKRVRSQVYAKSESELYRMIERERLRVGALKDGAEVMLDDYMATWLEQVRAENAVSTYKLREMIVRRYLRPHLGAMNLSSIRPMHVRGFLATLRERGAGERTIQVARASLSCVLNLAVEDELIESSPVGRVRQRASAKKPMRILSLDESRALLAAADESPLRALYYLALTTGMRQGEILALTWADVDLDGACVRVDATLTRDHAGALVRSRPKTESSRRTVHLPAMTVEALRSHRKAQSNRFGLVFSDSVGGAIRKDNLGRRSFYPMLEKAGLPRVTFHSLRHAANSILLAQGENVLTLAQRLGHSSTRMTLDTYSHVQPHTQRDAALKVNAAFAIGGVRRSDSAALAK